MTPDTITLLEGARNCVLGYSGVQPGERVLLWHDNSPEVDPLVLDAIASMVTTAEASLITLEERPPIFRLGEPLSPRAAEALASVDVLIHVFEDANAASIDSIHMLRFMFDHGLRITAVIANTAEELASSWARFPMELYWELFRRAAAQVTDAEFDLRDKNGTHLRGRLKGWVQESGARPAGVSQEGSWTFFPSGNIPLHPESPLEGTIVFDSMEGFGVLEEPITLQVADHRVTRVEGAGEPADWLRAQFRRFPNADYVCELCWGIHPKPSMASGLLSRSPDTTLYRHAGVWHCGLGMWPGVGVPCKFHWDGGATRGTLRVGDEILIDDGHFLLLDDPELHRFAAQFGDPDELLRVES